MKIAKWGTLAVVLLVALTMLLMVVPVGASPAVYPCNFYGTAMVNGVPVAAGTEISAWFGGVQVASTTTGAGGLLDHEYVFNVNLDEINEGATISFKIGALWANETGIWHKLQFVEVNLTATSGDTTPPTVINTSPVNGATNVSVNTLVTATFSEAIDPATIVFSLDSVGGNLSYAGTIATFDPTASLDYSTTYTASIQASDLAGNPMAAPYTWSFTTEADTTPPTVISTWPTNGATNASVNTLVTATFSEAIDPATIVFSLDSVGGNLSYAGTIATFDPTASLDYSTTYTASIQASDLAGNPMAAPYTWSFTTRAETTTTTVTPRDRTAPKVISTQPTSGATGVAVDTVVTATFSEFFIQGATVFSLDSVSGSLSYAGTKATFTPDANLDYSTTYTASIMAFDMHGNRMITPYIWSFTTEEAPAEETSAEEDSENSSSTQHHVQSDNPSGSSVVEELEVVSIPKEGLGTGSIIAIVVIGIIVIAGIAVAFVVIRRSA